MKSVSDFNKINVSIIIPVYGRSETLSRSILSILKSPGHEFVEIIIVDDFSPEAVKSELLREQDKLIRLPKNSGAAVSRNVGIDNASGDVICLLDSDDYIVDVDYENLYSIVSGSNQLWYCEIDSQSFSSDYPDNISCENYFSAIFNKYPHICQTSSLAFDKNIQMKFDVTLPKHQDWDFVHSYLKIFGVARKLPYRIYFDRSDQFSISRLYSPDKSVPWFNKLSEDKELDLKYVHYFLFCLSAKEYSLISFLTVGIGNILNGKMSVDKFLRFCFRRLQNV